MVGTLEICKECQYERLTLWHGVVYELSLSHSSRFANLFSSGYMCVKVSNVLDRSLPVDEKPRFDNVFLCRYLNKSNSSCLYSSAYGGSSAQTIVKIE